MRSKKNSQVLDAEIVSVGNELLIGHTLDTNSHWLAAQLNNLGWAVQRVTQLRDSLPMIVSGVRESLHRRPRVLMTLGGLGPTHDDITLIGVARALRRPLRLNREALRQIEEHYRTLETRPKLTKYRRKMATFPRGATPLPNPVGTAPGVMMTRSRTTIFCLPGVPTEMKAIFRSSIVPFLKASSGSPPRQLQLRIAGIIESALAPVLDEVRRAYPGLYFKSHPRGRETGPRPLILLHVYSTGSESEEDVAAAAAHIIQKVSRLTRTNSLPS